MILLCLSNLINLSHARYISPDNDMIQKASIHEKEMQMRLKSSLILALLSASAIIWLGAAQGSVVINEVEANPAGDEGAFKPLVSAWIELYNDDDKDVDISGWSVTNLVCV